MDGETFDLRAALMVYAAQSEDASRVSATFASLLDTTDDAFGRDPALGHFTGSAFVVSADGERTLLTHHRKLGLWLQPGGHADGDRDLRRVALREAEEETGLAGLTIERDIFDLDRHWIPERPGDPGHWHHDLRFVVHAGADESFAVSAESNALAWWSIAEVARGDNFDPSLRRMAHRWLIAHASHRLPDSQMPSDR